MHCSSAVASRAALQQSPGPGEESYSANQIAQSKGSSYMYCGTAPVCGVLTLETGYGTGYYKHDSPSVHGLWPQVPPYGNSACLLPKSKRDPDFVPKHPEELKCYDTGEGDYDHEYSFVDHEWLKHGTCMGVSNAADFLSIVCDLARKPLKLMAKATRKGVTTAGEMAHILGHAGYPIFNVDNYQQQVELSACAGPDHVWRLAYVNEFDKVCGSDDPRPTSPPVPEQCVPMQHGPPCAGDDDCDDVSGCVRCAKSGFCTDQPKPASD